MDWLILVLMAVAFLVSVSTYILMREPAKSPHAPVLDGDLYEVDEMIAAFGISEDWV